jgi:hypothetical protein
MGKSRNRNRFWNNGWGCNRVHNDRSGLVKWENLSTNETERRVQNEHTERQSLSSRRTNGLEKPPVTLQTEHNKQEATITGNNINPETRMASND